MPNLPREQTWRRKVGDADARTPTKISRQQARSKRCQQSLQAVGGGHRAPVQPEALFAVLEVLLRLHSLPVHPNRLTGIGQRRGQILRFPMSSGPVEDQVDDYGAVGTIESLRPEQDAAFAQGIIPQPAAILSALHHHIALETDHVVHGVAGVVGHLLYKADQTGAPEAAVRQQQWSDVGGAGGATADR